MNRAQIIDSHTGGEPTRVVIGGAPDLGAGSMAERLAVFRAEHDGFRSAVVNEPRGSDVLVGAVLCPPSVPGAVAGAIFFNNVGYLGMCGHGMIGFVITLAHLGRIAQGTHRIETAVGLVEAQWHGGAEVSVVNVPSYRKAAGVEVEVPGLGSVRGDVAWGGNWFFLAAFDHVALRRENIPQLLDMALRIRAAIHAAGYPEVDHIELYAPTEGAANIRNFVLCPGGAYDRSPCGTGTSAKLACLAAEGALSEGREWVQESIIGSTFRGSYQWANRAAGTIIPTITGSAHITAEATLLLDPSDPFRWGIS